MIIQDESERAPNTQETGSGVYLYTYGGSPHGRQNRHWLMLNASWRLLSCLDRQIGECTGARHNTLVYVQYWNVACLHSYSQLAHHTPQFT